MLQIAQGWKPGAISKRLLRLLKRAKTHEFQFEKSKPTRKVKKQVEDKPMLIVCRRNGEYIIEMQVEAENGGIDNCNPLIYKIAKADNPDRVRARMRKEKRLTREAVKQVWSDPYHPEICEHTCFKAYQQAMGLLPYDPENPECICSDAKVDSCLESSSYCSFETTSDCSSLDVDWEIHFSPPAASKKCTDTS